MTTFRRYETERHENGLPTKLIWLGDHHIPTKAELDAEKLRQHELIYGRRTE